MTSIIYANKFIVFRTAEPDALKAAMECDGICYVHVDVYDDMITVSITDPKTSEYIKPKELYEQIESKLKKYHIPYKYKKITF